MRFEIFSNNLVDLFKIEHFESFGGHKVCVQLQVVYNFILGVFHSNLKKKIISSEFNHRLNIYVYLIYGLTPFSLYYLQTFPIIFSMDIMLNIIKDVKNR